MQHKGDKLDLFEAREAAKLKGPPTWTEWVKYIRRVVDSPQTVAERMLLVLKAHRNC